LEKDLKPDSRGGKRKEKGTPFKLLSPKKRKAAAGQSQNALIIASIVWKGGSTVGPAQHGIFDE